jgi:hypothetical protein
MPNLAWNETYWGTDTDWTDRGEGWSIMWGNAEMQWFGSIYPRIPGQSRLNYPDNPEQIIVIPSGL